MNPKTFHSPEVRIVEASAGSGKTYALARRYVQLVLSPALTGGPIATRQVLALTFTNKAAFEMKARILEFLKKIALKQLSKKETADLLTPLGLDVPQASAKAFEVMGNIIRHYNFFQVQTIDKFINAILAGCAFKIGLTANFKIKTNSREYLQYSLDDLIDRARLDPKVLKTFEKFLHHYIYLENRSGWFPKEDMLAILTTLFEQYNTYAYPFKESLFSSEDVAKKKGAVLEEIRALRAKLPEGTHSGFLRSLDKFLAGHARGFDIDSVSDYFANEGVPVRKGAKVPREVDKRWDKIRKDLKSLCEQEAYSLFDPYVGVFRQAMDGFYALSSKDDCLFLNELNKRAGSLFDEDGVTVQELYYRLATRFHHYLIDEFQDTSRLQWRNLRTMAEEALSTGGTLFTVGDRKQAIYGFRGGDVGLFDDIRSCFGAFNVQVDLLTNNWRSQKEIVEFNNTVFSSDNLKNFIRQKESYEAEKNKKTSVWFNDEDILGVSRIFQSARQTPQVKDEGGYVRMEYIDIDKKEDRDLCVREKLISLVRGLKKRFAYRDIAILTRGNKEVKDVTDWLLQENIPVESERTSDITENNFIRELAAFFKFLASPIDNVSFASFIMGDIFTRAAGLKPEEMRRFIFDFKEQTVSERGLYLYIKFGEAYPGVWKEFIEEFFRNVGLYPLYELTVTMYKRFDVLNRCREAQGFLMHFLQLIKSQEEEHADIVSFLQYFEELQGEDLYVRMADSDAVKALTIHKSKGLEFPIVILPFLAMDIQIGSKGGEYQPSYILKQDGGKMELLRIKSKYLRFSEALKDIYGREYKKAFVDELNSMYVALTRPRYELYGFIPKKSGNSFNFAKFLIPEELYCRGKQKRYKPARPKDIAVTPIPPSDYPDWIDYLKDEFLKADQLRNRQERFKGEVMHYILSLIGNLSGAGREKAVNEALKAAKDRFPQIGDGEEYEKRVNALIDCAAARRFFYCGEAEVFTEKEMVDRFGRTRRSDRLVVLKDEVWVADYKSAKSAEGDHRAQVEEYKQMLIPIYPGKTVKGFLIYLDCFEVEGV